MNRVKIKSTYFDDVKRRIIKILRYGKEDAQTPMEISPFGIDGGPLKDMIALYAATDDKKPFIVGYINKNQLADVGELRLFSTDADGGLKTYVWLRNNGTIEMMGDDDNMVRYSELEKGFNKLRDDLNNHIQNFNTHVHIGVTSGTSSSGTPSAIDTPSSATITASKINEIKTFK